MLWFAGKDRGVVPDGISNSFKLDPSFYTKYRLTDNNNTVSLHQQWMLNYGPKQQERFAFKHHT